MYDQMVQGSPPELPKPLRFAEPSHESRADGVVDADEGPAIPGLRQRVVPEAAQGPDLGAVVGALDGGCDIAAAALLIADLVAGKGFCGAVHVLNLNLFQPCE